MKNSLFRRHFLLTAGMILISFALLTAAFKTVSYRYMVQEKKATLTQNATYAATLIQELLDYRNEYTSDIDAFPNYSPALSAISDCDILVCSDNGTVLRYSANTQDDDAEDGDYYIGNVISPYVAEQLLTEGSYAAMSDLGIYSSVHFISGTTIHLSAGEGNETTSLVFMSTSASD